MYSQIYNKKDGSKGTVKTFPNTDAIAKMQKLSMQRESLENKETENHQGNAEFDAAFFMLILLLFLDSDALPLLSLIPLLML